MTAAKEYHPLPQPEEISVREREDAMGAYLMMFAAVAVAVPLPVINLIAAIVYYYLNRTRSRFIHFHALQSLITQLPTTLINWGLLYWSLQIFFTSKLSVNDAYLSYLVFAIAANLAYFVFSMIAAVKARKGRFYYFIGFGRYCYEVVYGASNRLEYRYYE